MWCVYNTVEKNKKHRVCIIIINVIDVCGVWGALAHTTFDSHLYCTFFSRSINSWNWKQLMPTYYYLLMHCSGKWHCFVQSGVASIQRRKTLFANTFRTISFRASTCAEGEKSMHEWKTRICETNDIHADILSRWTFRISVRIQFKMESIHLSSRQIVESKWMNWVRRQASYLIHCAHNHQLT